MSDGQLPPPTPPTGWQPITPPTTPQPRTSKRKQWLIGGGIACVAVLLVIGAATNDNDDTGSPDGDGYDAHAMCAEFTRDRLKAPSTADFPEYNDRGVIIRHSGNAWTVTSYVDAENSFGGNIRTHFTCVVQDQGDKWRLQSWAED